MTRVMLPAALVLVTLVVATRAGGAVAPRAQEAPAEGGAAPVGEVSFRFVGRQEYRPAAFLAYGYLSAMSGVEPDRLFVDPDAPAAATARLTYVAETRATTQPAGDGSFVVDGVGTLTVFLSERGGAAFDDPGSFAGGVPIATADIRVRDLVHQAANGVTIATSEADLTHTTAEPFTLGPDRYRLGHVGLRQRWRATGVAGGDGGLAGAPLAVAGVVVTTQRAGPSAGASPVATPPAAACPGVAAWLEQTAARVARAASLRATISPDLTVEAADADALGALATELAELAAAQRADVPADATAANRLPLAALSTYARGADLAAIAAAAADGATFAQALDILGDGDNLAARAAAATDEVAAACDGGG